MVEQMEPSTVDWRVVPWDGLAPPLVVHLEHSLAGLTECSSVDWLGGGWVDTWDFQWVVTKVGRSVQTDDWLV